jgi:23S rRNA (adenine2503-C2)-methyltransferase
MQNIFDYNIDELKDSLKSKGFSHFLAKQIFGWVYKRKVEDFDSMTDISKEARKYLKANFHFSHPNLIKREASSDGTEKFLFKLKDSSIIETVFIPEEKRNTLCVSTQVGCKFKCKFCLSGESGFKRNLNTGEIINQYLAVCDLIAPKRITNVVFMGIGEPLDNLDNTIKTISILTSKEGINLSKKKICISSCGLVPEIKKLAELDLDVKLSISLHSADDGVRSMLMPVNKKYPLKDLMAALKQFYEAKGQAITFEYVLLGGLNTKKEDALSLVKLLHGIKAKINLIPYNGECLEFKAPGAWEIDSFKNALKEKGILATLRKSRGQDIKAACGQLRATFNM